MSRRNLKQWFAKRFCWVSKAYYRQSRIFAKNLLEDGVCFPVETMLLLVM